MLYVANFSFSGTPWGYKGIWSFRIRYFTLSHLMGAQWKCYFPDYDVRAAPPNSYSSLFTLHHICQLAPLFPVKHHTLVQKRKVWFIDSHALGKQADIPCECTQRKGDPRGGRVVRETWFHHGEQQSWQRSACRWRQTAALRFPLQKKSRLVQYTEAGDRIYRSSSKPNQPTDRPTHGRVKLRPVDLHLSRPEPEGETESVKVCCCWTRWGRLPWCSQRVCVAAWSEVSGLCFSGFSLLRVSTSDRSRKCFLIPASQLNQLLAVAGRGVTCFNWEEMK